MNYNGPLAPYIKPYKTTVVPSIFMLHGPTELFPFLTACREQNSEVLFENEQIYVSVADRNDIGKMTMLSVYGMVTDESCNILEQYVRYRNSIENKA